MALVSVFVTIVIGAPILLALLTQIFVVPIAFFGAIAGYFFKQNRTENKSSNSDRREILPKIRERQINQSWNRNMRVT